MAKLEEIFKQKINKTIEKETVHKFSLDEERFYLWLVSAKAQAWWQRFTGDHTIKLTPKFNPFLEQLSLYKILEFVDLDVLSLTEPEPEDTFLSSLFSKSKPWISIYSLLSSFLSIEVNAQAKSGKQVLVLKTDDEDLQIKLNGKRQINKEPKAHKYWYWCGRTLKGVVKVFSKSFKKEDNINLVELFSDRTPRVSKFSISLKRIPTRDNPRWTGNFDDDIEELLLARLIFGEAENQPREAKIGAGFTVINRVKKQRSNWGFSNREVILKEGEYNAFWHQDRREKVRDPLAAADALTKKAWQESYQIALDILNSSLEDSTEGATNFHSFPEEEKSRFPPWATDKNFKITLRLH